MEPTLNGTDWASAHFRWAELLDSETAERHDLVAQQYAPSGTVIAALRSLVATTLEPARLIIEAPMLVTSGYRCDDVDRILKGLTRSQAAARRPSQHTLGEAADVQMLPSFTADRYWPQRDFVREAAAQGFGVTLRGDVGRNFYLFALFAMNMELLNVDQLIHEFGQPGAPAWVHVSSVRRAGRRTILSTVNGRAYQAYADPAAALRLGASL